MLSVSLAGIGKLGTSAAFSATYIYSVEIFPTVARNTGIGYASCFARIASISAPQIALLGDYVAPWLPFVVYGAVATLGGLLVLLLPETLRRPLPQTVSDSIALHGSRPLKADPGALPLNPADNEQDAIEKQT